MLSRSNRNQILVLVFIVGLIIMFSFFTVVTNIYVAPVLDGYGLPDIFIYLKLGMFVLLFVVLIVWLKNDFYKLTRQDLKVLMTIGLILLFVYFLSLFLYKYYLISDTASIIRDKILNGNPALALDFSAINYKSLRYITTIYGGFNSEIILFAEAMLFQSFLVKIKYMEVDNEPVQEYDVFMFDTLLFPLSVILAMASFSAINIFRFRFDLIGAIEVGIGLLGFIIALSTVFPAFRIYKTKGSQCTKSYFAGSYHFLVVLSILGILVFGALTYLNIDFYQTGRETYRIIPSSISLLLSLVILIRTIKIIRLENK